MCPDVDNLSVADRVSQLERSLRRTRALLFSLGVVAFTLLLVGWRRAGDVKADKLILTDGTGIPVLVPKGVIEYDGPLLRIESPSGKEVLTLGSGIRRVP